MEPHIFTQLTKDVQLKIVAEFLPLKEHHNFSWLFPALRPHPIEKVFKNRQELIETILQHPPHPCPLREHVIHITNRLFDPVQDTGGRWRDKYQQCLFYRHASTIETLVVCQGRRSVKSCGLFPQLDWLPLTLMVCPSLKTLVVRLEDEIDIFAETSRILPFYMPAQIKSQFPLGCNWYELLESRGIRLIVIQVPRYDMWSCRLEMPVSPPDCSWGMVDLQSSKGLKVILKPEVEVYRVDRASMIQTTQPGESVKQLVTQINFDPLTEIIVAALSAVAAHSNSDCRPLAVDLLRRMKVITLDYLSIDLLFQKWNQPLRDALAVMAESTKRPVRVSMDAINNCFGKVKKFIKFVVPRPQILDCDLYLSESYWSKNELTQQLRLSVQNLRRALELRCVPSSLNALIGSWVSGLGSHISIDTVGPLLSYLQGQCPQSQTDLLKKLSDTVDQKNKKQAMTDSLKVFSKHWAVLLTPILFQNAALMNQLAVKLFCPGMLHRFMQELHCQAMANEALYHKLFSGSYERRTDNLSVLDSLVQKISLGEKPRPTALRSRVVRRYVTTRRLYCWDKVWRQMPPSKHSHQARAIAKPNKTNKKRKSQSGQKARQ